LRFFPKMGCVASKDEVTEKPRSAIKSLKIPGKKKTEKSFGSIGIVDANDDTVQVDYELDRAVDNLRAESKINLALNAKRRGDIFDESFTPDAKELQNFKKPLVTKSDGVVSLLEDAMHKNILFRDLSSSQLQYVLNALSKKKVKSKTIVIEQGEEGDTFYIVEKGSFRFIVDGEEVGLCKAGESFGELALLYNCPRAATVESHESSELWCLERSTYRHIIAGNVAKKQQEVRKALRKVSILQGLSGEQIGRLLDAVETVRFKAGETIIRKGDAGNIFFMIKKGQVKCTRAGVRASQSDITLGEGEYFGERSLLTKEPRAANVIAMIDTECLVLDKETFSMLLGPLRQVLDANLGLRVIAGIPMFAQLSQNERRKLMKALKEERFKDGDTIIKQNAAGDKFYLIREGTAKVTKTVEGSRNGDSNVAELVAGDYFGEGALLKDEPRAANVVAVTEVVCLTMSRSSFEKLLGPLQKIMQRELDNREDQIEEAVKDEVKLVEDSLKLSDLKLLQTLGTGTFGRVKLVDCPKLNQTYALKILQKSQIVAYRQERNVMNEKEILLECRHPFILKLFRTFKDKHSLYLLLEVVLGGELFTLLHIRGGALQNNDARFYAACVLDAFVYLHEKTIVYRDLKPENLMIDELGYIKVVDFGFAKRVEDKTYTLCGTPEYLSPELVLGKGHNKAVDNWAVGILIFEMLTGSSPFADPINNDHLTICKQIVRTKVDYPRRFPEKAKDLLSRLLIRDAFQRLGSHAKGTAEIKEHPWFQPIDWNELVRKRSKAPWVPPIKDSKDTSNFDEYPEDDYVEPYKPDGSNWDADF